MEKKKIIILNGGISPEKEVSKKTGKAVFEALSKREEYIVIMYDYADYESIADFLINIKKEKPYVVFNALHGEDGENGKIQALFDMEKIPYTGSGYYASAIAMNKFLSNLIVKNANIPVPNSILLKNNKDYNNIKIEKFPIVVKPNDKGSSVGISIVDSKDYLGKALDKAFEYSNEVLLEDYIAGRELTVTILGDKALPVVEIVPKNGWYDYTNKYTKGKTEYIAPAKLTETEKRKIQEYALEIFNLMGCEIYGRVDFRYNGEEFYFLEVNTLPGMTQLSLTPMAAKSFGMSFEDLIIFIIEKSKRRRL